MRVVFLVVLTLFAASLSGCAGYIEQHGRGATIEERIRYSYTVGEIRAEATGVSPLFTQSLAYHLDRELAARGLKGGGPEARVDVVIAEYKMVSDLARVLAGGLLGTDDVVSRVAVNGLDGRRLGYGSVKTHNILAGVSMDGIAKSHAESLVDFIQGK